MKTEISNIINQLKNGSSKEKENAFKILVNDYKDLQIILNSADAEANQLFANNGLKQNGRCP